MLSKMKTMSLAATMVVAGAFSANAAVFDFAALADGLDGGSEGVWSSVIGGGWTQGGVTVWASAAGTDDAYLDSGNAGLGVCSVWDKAGQCTPGDDDNVDYTMADGYETLQLRFSNSVEITEIVLRDSIHNEYVLNDDIWFNGDNAWGLYTVGIDGTDVFGSGSFWSFEVGSDPSSQFYISSITVAVVPLPAGGLMLLTALGGIAVAKRRWKKAKA